jgi:hypothetical protein
MNWLSAHSRGVGPLVAGIGALVVGLGAGYVIWKTDPESKPPRLMPSDAPPPEFLYLDTERTLAYLGEIRGGLSDSEKRTESNKATRTANVKSSLTASLSADLGASRERQQAIEEVVTPKATDRFVTLLDELRSGRSVRGDQTRKWLHDLNARLTKTNTVEDVRARLETIHEGDFVRIEDAQLFLAPYAAAVPKARYASSYLGGQIRQPPRPLYAPISRDAQRDRVKYLRNLGADPILPFVAPTLSEGRNDRQVVTFLVPARYTALLDNARLLAGNLTIVGKVVYKDPRLPGEGRCPEPGEKSLPCRYFDRETLSTFAPALQAAPRSVLESLGMKEDEVLSRVRSSVTFGVPLVVVLPVAIYQ